MIWLCGFIFFKKFMSDAYTTLSSTIKDSHEASCMYAECLLDEVRGTLLAFTLYQPLCLMMEAQIQNLPLGSSQFKGVDTKV